MITGIEIPYLFAFFYPGLNYIWLWPKLKPIVEKEIKHESKEMDGVEIYDYHLQTKPPTYVNVNNIIIPIDGSTYKKEQFLLSKHISDDKKEEYINYYQIDDKEDINMSFTKESYINTQSELIKTFNQYQIPIDRVAINLPLHIKYYNYKNGFYVHKLGDIVASNKDKLVKEVLWRKRLPLSITIPTVAGMGLLCCWSYYALDTAGGYYYENQYYPPFHPKRIKGYFSTKK